MKLHDLFEIIAGILLFAGLCVLVAAAALVSVALALFVAGVFVVLIAAGLLYVAVTIERRDAAALEAAAKPRGAS